MVAFSPEKTAPLPALRILLCPLSSLETAQGGTGILQKVLYQLKALK